MSEASAGSVPTVATAEADKLPETADRSLLTELYSRPNSRLLDICQVTGSLDIQHCPLWHSGAGISRDPNYHTLGSPAVQLTAKRCHLVFGFGSVHRMFKTRVATRNPRLLLFSCAFIRIFLSFRNQVHNFDWFPDVLLSRYGSKRLLLCCPRISNRVYQGIRQIREGWCSFYGCRNTEMCVFSFGKSIEKCSCVQEVILIE